MCTDVTLHFYHLRCFDTVFRKPYWYFSIALKMILPIDDVFRHRLFKCLPLKVLLRFIIRMQLTCLVRSRSRWFSGYLIWLSRKERKRRKLKWKKKICFAFPSPLALARSHYSPLKPGNALLAGNSFIVRCHVTSKKPTRAHAVRKKNPAI